MPSTVLLAIRAAIGPAQVPLFFTFFLQVLIQSPFSRILPISDYELLERRYRATPRTGPDTNHSLKVTEEGRRTRERGGRGRGRTVASHSSSGAFFVHAKA